MQGTTNDLSPNQLSSGGKDLTTCCKINTYKYTIYVQVNKKNCAKLKRQCRDDKLQSKKGPKQDRDDFGLECIKQDCHHTTIPTSLPPGYCLGPRVRPS